MPDTTDNRPSSKVARLISEYDLDGLGDELEVRWTGDGVERTSLRDLADYFNEQLLERALIDAGMSALDSDVSSTYRNLTDEDVSTGVRTDARARLENNGIDIDNLESDFVSYQAIRSYLTEYRDAEYEEPSAAERVESVLETVQRLRSRLRSITEGSLTRLRSTDRLTLGTFRLFVDVDVLCEDCDAQYGVAELLERGGCDCDGD